MHTITIKRLNTGDWEKLQNIGRETFSETFSAENAAENMKQYLDESFSEDKLKAELSNPHSRFYFALLENKVIAYLKLNFGSSQTELQDNKAVEIERIYVLKAFQGQKTGQLLYEKAVEDALSYGAHYLWLGVWEANYPALQFYTKNGFVAFDKHIFRLGNDEQTDIMMKRTLK